MEQHRENLLPPAQLRYNGKTTLSRFKVYNVMIRYMYIFSHDYHNQVSYYICHLTVAIVFLIMRVVRAFLIYSFSNFQVYHTVSLTVVTILYVRSPELIYSTYNWKFVPFGYLHPHDRQSTVSMSLLIINIFAFLFLTYFPYYSVLKFSPCCINGRFPSFLRLNNTLLYVMDYYYMYQIFFIHSSIMNT